MTELRKLKSICVGLHMCLLLTIPALGQNTGQITGVVKDPDQALVYCSPLTLTNQRQTKAKNTTVTDAQGSYSFLSLAPGAYVVEADAPGFKPGITR